MSHEERLTEAVARAISKAAFTHHGEDKAEEARLWAETKAVRMVQAEAAIAAYRTYDERR